MKTFIALTLAGLIGTVAPARPDPAGDEDPCAAVGKVSAILAGLRDEGITRTNATLLLVTLEPQAGAAIEKLARVVYDPQSAKLDGEVLELLTVKACRRELQELQGKP